MKLVRKNWASPVINPENGFEFVFSTYIRESNEYKVSVLNAEKAVVAFGIFELDRSTGASGELIVKLVNTTPLPEQIEGSDPLLLEGRRMANDYVVAFFRDVIADDRRSIITLHDHLFGPRTADSNSSQEFGFRP